MIKIRNFKAIDALIPKLFIALTFTFICGLLSGCGGSSPSDALGTSSDDSTSDTTRVEFVSAADEVISYREQTNVTFEVLDSSNASVSNATISFSITDPGAIGISLSDSSLTTNDSGEVTVTVQSGDLPGVFSITASSSGTTTESDEITVAAGPPIQNQINIGMDRNIPDAFNIVNQTTEVVVLVADIKGNPVRDGTRVNFDSPECGVVGTSCTTVDGVCTVNWSTLR